MNRNEALQQKLADWRPAGPGRHTFAFVDQDTGCNVALEAERNDELGCLLWELTLRPTSSVAGALQAWANRIASRVTSLLEPLKVIEVDASRNEALLRSSEPAKRGTALLYFEVLLKGTNEARLCRYQSSNADFKPRTQVNAPLTHEALVKFISDATE
jgi:hypothetical protein